MPAFATSEVRPLLLTNSSESPNGTTLSARDLDLHPAGRHLAIPFFDNSVRLYDMGN